MEKIDWNDWFYYDETSPSCLRWKVDRVSGRYNNQIHVKKGDIAGSLGSSGYYSVKLNNKLYLCHRVVYEMHNDVLTNDYQIDHLDQNKLNNKLDNLKKVTASENYRNFPKRKDNASGYVGVSIMNNGQGTWYCSANWNTIEGKSLSKRFSIKKFGLLPAFAQAVAYREKMIAELNEQGAGYSDRHGT